VAFDVGSKRKVRPQMNVTPLVDVVLVLLIIFMVITPLMQKQFWLNIPKDDAAEAAKPRPAKETPLVVTVADSGAIQINGQPIEDAAFPAKLLRIFAARRDRVLFFDALHGVPYGRAVQVMDLARGAGASSIAIATEALAK
jgi:biopolymer transport protein TolR